MKRFMILLMVMAMALVTGCASKYQMTDEQAGKYFYQPFIILAFGQAHQVNGWKDLQPVLKDYPPAFSIRITEAQAVNTNYHKHLAATFRQMGYQLTQESLLDASPQPAPAPVQVQQKKSGKKVQTPPPAPAPRQMLVQMDFELMGYQGNVGHQNQQYNGYNNNGYNSQRAWEQGANILLMGALMLSR